MFLLAAAAGLAACGGAPAGRAGNDPAAALEAERAAAAAAPASEPEVLADGIPACPDGPVRNFLAPEAQQCWYSAPQGRWRIIDHDFHYDVLLLQVKATSLDLGDEALRRIREIHDDRYSEISVYVAADGAPPPTLIRRVRWTKAGGIDYLEFMGAIEG